ncbi:hypothetical protein [uncultured Clostridium sp.]|uniref:hypothetical protein n=1 Tax=uncultured Clostridium sp. TaxID=59620 RepID=UPI002589E796|nr:hypothetical protein [uncultured Clostridium sp.]
MDEKKLWLKISGSITYYFKSFNRTLSNEDLWLDYVEYALQSKGEDGAYTYLDKQTLERIVIDEKMMNKAKAVFIERLEKRRVQENLVKEEKKFLAPVIEFSKYKNKRL